TTKIIQNNINPFRFEIRASFSCRSSNTVYLLECKRCRIKYIAETERDFKARLMEHRSLYNREFKKQVFEISGPFTKHFRETSHDFCNISACLLKSGFKDTLERRAFESFLIHKFDTHSIGLNQNYGMFSFYVL